MVKDMVKDFVKVSTDETMLKIDAPEHARTSVENSIAIFHLEEAVGILEGLLSEENENVKEWYLNEAKNLLNKIKIVKE